MADTLVGGNLQQAPAVFEVKEYLSGTCSLRPLTANTALASAHQLVSIDPWLTLGYSQESLAHYLQRPDASLHRFLASVSGQDVGVVCCRYPWLFGPFLELLAVYQQFQGQGFGQEILGWVEHQAVSANVWTTVSAFNLRALNFYTKLGFEKVGRLTNLIRAGFDEILLRKTIQ